METVVDSSLLVSLINPKDHWHTHTISLMEALQAASLELIYLDCVIAESISTALRRVVEKKLFSEIDPLFERLNQSVPSDSINWAFPEVPDMYPDVISLMQSTKGDLNFNDALIAIICREYKIPAIASYDTDFDQISWLKRISKPDDI